MDFRVFFVISLIAGMVSVAAQSYDSATTLVDCYKVLASRAKSVVDIDSLCYEAAQMAKCYVRVSGIADLDPSPQDIQKLEDLYNDSLRENNVQCQVDLRTIIAQLRAEKRNGGTRNVMHVGFMATITVFVSIMSYSLTY